VIGDELAVEQAETADLEARDQPGERDLRRVAFAAEHAFPEEGAAQPHAVEPADQKAVAPAFDRMGMAAPVEIGIGGFDRGVYPGVGPVIGRFRALRHDLGKGGVTGDGEAIRTDHLGQRARQAELVDRQYTALLGLDPIDVVGATAVRHREHADRIGSEEQVGVDRLHVWIRRRL